MVEKVGRNDPCPCGSGKKYKNCCLQKEQAKGSLFGKRKFKATVLSAGGVHKPLQEEKPEPGPSKVSVDYATLMERAYGESLHAYEEKPPVPQNPLEYKVNDQTKEQERLSE
jgi:uncharacterized protein